MSKTLVTAFYRFVALDDYCDLRQPLLEWMGDRQIKGTVLLAPEGINGTIAGPETGVAELFEWFDRDPRLAAMPRKTAWHDQPPFFRTKVRLKKEIVKLGVDGIDPRKHAGTYVPPTEWNQLISDPAVTVIDTRNDYEVQIGTFENAVQPHTQRFSELPDYIEQQLAGDKNKKIAMFCTGGIRCEKSTAYLKQQGFEQVYHLEGGILNYLAQVPEEESLWQGECFVFDRRVAVNHQLEQGEYEECHACRMPLSAEDRQCESYQPGVSCRHCQDQRTDNDRQRFKERERQVELAEQRGETHLGGEVEQLASRRKQAKRGLKQRHPAFEEE
ncbi:MAG: rhodanese-related sulfurtransferase [Immundisolibacteraceae bacterium]|nr:rhodanese-related sulfurtransferase [Immundisolibacteraceae bacterium]